MAGVRPERVASEIRAALTELLQRGELRDPRVGYITITQVRMTPDLRLARVSYSMMGTDEEKERTQEGLTQAKSFLRSAVAKKVKLRVSPNIAFEYDATLEDSDRIDTLLREVRKKEGW